MSEAAVVNILATHAQPVPLDDVHRALGAYGVAGRITGLTSERDQTLLVERGDGERFIFKIANPAERRGVVAYQLAAMAHLEHTAPALPVPRVIRGPEGEAERLTAFPDGTERVIALLSFLPGRPLYTAPPSAAQARDIGRVLGGLDAGMIGFDLPPPNTHLLWDHTHIADLRPLLQYVEGPLKARVEGVLDRFDAQARPVMQQLPRQVIHNDFNPHNIIVADETPERVTGIIDFGDMVRAPRVQDVAVALAYQIPRGGSLALAEATLKGYAEAIRLSDAEAGILPALVAARMAMTVIITQWRAALYPQQRDYILRNQPGAILGLDVLADHPPDALAAMVRATREGD